MNLLGWNVLPDDCATEFKFEDGPGWLKILALTPYFERFAYPMAVRRGLEILWCNSLNRVETEVLESLGWIIQTREKTKMEHIHILRIGLYPLAYRAFLLHISAMKPIIEWN